MKKRNGKEHREDNKRGIRNQEVKEKEKEKKTIKRTSKRNWKNKECIILAQIKRK